MSLPAKEKRLESDERFFDNTSICGSYLVYFPSQLPKKTPKKSHPEKRGKLFVFCLVHSSFPTAPFGSFFFLSRLRPVPSTVGGPAAVDLLGGMDKFQDRQLASWSKVGCVKL